MYVTQGDSREWERTPAALPFFAVSLWYMHEWSLFVVHTCLFVVHTLWCIHERLFVVHTWKTLCGTYIVSLWCIHERLFVVHTWKTLCGTYIVSLWCIHERLFVVHTWKTLCGAYMKDSLWYIYCLFVVHTWNSWLVYGKRTDYNSRHPVRFPAALHFIAVSVWYIHTRVRMGASDIVNPWVVRT